MSASRVEQAPASGVAALAVSAELVTARELRRLVDASKQEVRLDEVEATFIENPQVETLTGAPKLPPLLGRVETVGASARKACI